MIGPPVENAYAVDPVGVAHSRPSQPKRSSGRSSTATAISSIRSRLVRSSDASLSAHVRAVTVPS